LWVAADFVKTVKSIYCTTVKFSVILYFAQLAQRPFSAKISS
jgi:hypothetical protein